MTSRLIIIIPALFLTAATLGLAMDLKDITYTTGAGKVVFSHTLHLQKKSRTTSNFRCKACHDGKSAFTVKENCEKCHQA